MTAEGIRSINVQLQRLRRHYDHSVRTYDEISLLDLANVLRAWADMRDLLTDEVPSFGTTMRFKSAVPSGKVMRFARGHENVLAFMADPVVTYAGDGVLASRDQVPAGSWYVAVEVKRREDGGFEVLSYTFIHEVTGDAAPRPAGRVSRGNFQQWLGAEVVRLTYAGTDRVLASTSISREVMIRRAANTLGGSHPMSVASEGRSQFDPAVRYLMTHKVGGVPLPYFILLKAAQDILSIAPDLMPR